MLNIKYGRPHNLTSYSVRAYFELFVGKLPNEYAYQSDPETSQVLPAASKSTPACEGGTICSITNVLRLTN